MVLGLLRLHLQAAADGVEGVGNVCSADSSELGARKLGGNAASGALLLPGVDGVEGVVHAKVCATEGHDTDDGYAKAVVEGEDTLGALGSLGEAVNEAVELLLARAYIGSKTGTSVIQRVDDAKGASACKTAGSNVDSKNLSELGILVVLGEESLDGVLEGKVECLGGEVPDDVHAVTSPECLEALLLVHAGEAVDDASVSGNLAADDLRVSILGLDDKLDALDGSSASKMKIKHPRNKKSDTTSNTKKKKRTFRRRIMFVHKPTDAPNTNLLRAPHSRRKAPWHKPPLVHRRLLRTRGSFDSHARTCVGAFPQMPPPETTDGKRNRFSMPILLPLEPYLPSLSDSAGDASGSKILEKVHRHLV